MKNWLFIGFCIANLYWWSVEAIRAYLSKYYNYSFTVYYARVFGQFEWLGDVIIFIIMAVLSFTYAYISIKEGDIE